MRPKPNERPLRRFRRRVMSVVTVPGEYLTVSGWRVFIDNIDRKAGVAGGVFVRRPVGGRWTPASCQPGAWDIKTGAVVSGNYSGPGADNSLYSRIKG